MSNTVIDGDLIEDFKVMKSSHLDKLGEALAKAQGAMLAAKKERINPFLKSKYADLSNVWDACRKPLSDNGLSIIQITVGCRSNLQIETILLHKSGQYIKGLIPVLLGKQDMQGLGAAITYARRFALAAIVGVYQDDNDGEGGDGAGAGAGDDRLVGYDAKTTSFLLRCIEGIESGIKTKEEILVFIADRMEVTQHLEEIIKLVKVK